VFPDAADGIAIDQAAFDFSVLFQELPCGDSCRSGLVSAF
jgi:hypothetical protein